MAKGFCTCERDFPARPDLHPPANATWHYLCDKPTNPLHWRNVTPGEAFVAGQMTVLDRSRIVPTGTGWPVK